MNRYSKQQIQDTLVDKGYKYFTGGKPYNLNIVGVRNSATGDKVTNAFDDTMTVSYADNNGVEHYHEYKCTTDPGKHWVENVMNKSGVAILKPGQYRGSHQIGLHQGKYEALCQRKPLSVYRDNNKDGEYNLDENTVETGIFGINIHKAGSREKGSTQIDKWSAGCQVFAIETEFYEFMLLAHRAKDNWGNGFTYTLLDSNELC